MFNVQCPRIGNYTEDVEYMSGLLLFLYINKEKRANAQSGRGCRGTHRLTKGRVRIRRDHLHWLACLGLASVDFHGIVCWLWHARYPTYFSI